MIADSTTDTRTHRSVASALVIGLLVTVGLVAGACAPMPELKREAREYRNADFENEFIAYRNHCVAKGGRVFILANGSVDRRGIPSRGTYYTCS